MSIRVAFPFVGDTIGGSHVSAALLMSELPRHGFSPVAVVHRDGPLMGWLKERELAYLPANLPYIPIEAGAAAGVARIFTSAPPLSAFLRENSFSIVHANDGRMITTWMLAARLAGCNTVAHLRQPWTASRRFQIAFSFVQKAVAISAFVEATIPRGPKRRSIVVANPFEPSHVPEHEARNGVSALVGEKRPVLAFLGTLMKRKKPDVFLRAAAIIQKKFPSCRFLIIGREGDCSDPAHELCEKLGLRNAVVFSGFRPDASALLAGVDLLLAPAVDEAHGRTLVEAMMAGVPVIAAASGGHLEIVDPGKTGLLVPPDDPQALAESAVVLLADLARRSAMANVARDWAQKNFSAAAHAQAIADVYRGLLNPA